MTLTQLQKTLAELEAEKQNAQNAINLAQSEDDTAEMCRYQQKYLRAEYDIQIILEQMSALNLGVVEQK